MPEEWRRRQMAALTNLVIAGARTQPIVLAVEDAHWADPSTLDLLRGIAERGALASLFVLITARPEFRAPWGVRSHHGTISLVPLAQAKCARRCSRCWGWGGGRCRCTPHQEQTNNKQTIVARYWQPSAREPRLSPDSFQHLHNIGAAEVEPRLDRRREAGERIDDRQHPQFRSGRRLIVH